MRVLTGVLLAFLCAPCLAGDDAKPVTAEEAVAEVRAVIAALRTKKLATEGSLAPWRIRPQAFARATFGPDYEDLDAARKQVVEQFGRFVLGRILREEAGVLRGLKGEPELTVASGEGGTQVVSSKLRIHVVRFVVARRGADAVEVVDVGAKDMLIGQVIGTAWRAALTRLPAERSRADALMSLVAVLTKSIQVRARKVKSRDNIRTLLTVMLGRRMQSAQAGWPPFGGKSFVLSVVAHGDLDVSKAENRAVLFSPNVPAEVRAQPEAYEEVTLAALREGRAWSTKWLTSYAGRRNDEEKYKITPAEERRGAIVLADLSFADVVIVGYTNGVVKELSRKDLGLEPGDDFVVGDEAKSEELKKLSTR